MAKVKITNATLIHGEHTPIGAVRDVEERVARSLFIAGKAVPYAEEPAKPTTREKPDVRDGEADPGIHTASAGPACRKCGQDLADRRRKRIDDGDGVILCAKCAKG